jgi:hypothetical protein
MNFSRISLAFSSLAACSLFVACAAPVDAADMPTEELAANVAADSNLETAGWGDNKRDDNGNNGGGWGTGGNSGGNKNWSWDYAQAVAEANAVASSGGTAQATATAFANRLKKKKDWSKQACVTTALAVAEAVAIDSCTGGLTVARAVAEVRSC